MEQASTFAGNPRRVAAAPIAMQPRTARARQFVLSLLVSLLMSLSAGIVVVGVLLVSLGIAVALGGGGR